MPDLDLVTASGPRRVFSLLHDARPVLLQLGERGASTSRRGRIGFSASMPATRARGSCPAIGAVAAPGHRADPPDGYVAWVGEGTDEGPRDALTRWFGPPRDG